MPRGFASLSPDRLREIARKGGRTPHRRGFSDSEVARRAGRIGGSAPRRVKPYGYASRGNITTPKDVEAVG